MLKEQQRIYNLGDLTNLFATKERDFFKEIPPKEIGKRARTVLFGGHLKAHSSLNNPIVRYWHTNFRYYVDIIKSFERMIQAYGYLIKYPAFKYYNLYRINELAWIKYHSEYFVQEHYILLQRAKGWMNHLIKRTKKVPRRKVEEKQLERIRDQFTAWSKKINIIRNEHVHEFTFEGKDYGAAEIAMLLISKGKMKELKPIKNLAIFNISDEWKKIFKENTLALINNYDKALGRVKRILLRLE